MFRGRVRRSRFGEALSCAALRAWVAVSQQESYESTIAWSQMFSRTRVSLYTGPLGIGQSYVPESYVKKSQLCIVAVFALLTALSAQSIAPSKLTIEAIFADGGITGREPETIKWSPDGTKVSFVQRDDSGEHGELWYVDTTTGEKKVLVSETKLTQLSPPLSKIKDEREKERVTRYHVAAYLWSPDSKHLLFDSQGQLWYFDLDTGTGVQLTASSDPSDDPKFSPDGKRLAYVRKHNLYVHPVAGELGEYQLTRDETKDKDKDKSKKDDKEDNILNGEVDWVYAEELAVRSNFFWSPEGHEILF